MNRLRILLVALVAPATIGLAAALLQLLWLPSLPDPAAIDWGVHGVAGTGPAWPLTVATAVIALGIPALLTAIVLAGGGGDRLSISSKVGAVAPLFAVTIVSAAMTVAIGGQRGLASAAQAPDISPAIPWCLLAGAALAAVGWFVLPRAHRPGSDAVPATPLPLGADERAVWVGRARPTTATGLAVSVVVAVLVLAAVIAVGASGGRMWPLLAIPLLLALVLIVFLDWRVRVDADGLVVRSLLGWPVIRVAAADVLGAAATDVRPMAYGGWGLRGVPGGTIAVVTRSGDGLVVRRRRRGDLVVTVDDAATAASLLSAYAGHVAA